MGEGGGVGRDKLPRAGVQFYLADAIVVAVLYRTMFFGIFVQLVGDGHIGDAVVAHLFFEPLLPLTDRLEPIGGLVAPERRLG